jgi:hypothetical protein
MVSKAAYGEKVWDEMGDDLSKWNLEAVAVTNEALFSFWLVDVIPLCEYTVSHSRGKLSSRPSAFRS